MEIRYAYLHYENDKVKVYKWGVKGIGFGEVVINAQTNEIIDDECMGEEFCREIIAYAEGD